MEKRLTLNQTWALCLRQWKWVIKKLAQMDNMTPDELVLIIDNLKEQWLDEHGFNKNTLACNCFFCEYSRQNRSMCESCPGRLVSRRFYCECKTYDYQRRPGKFYKKLLTLNAKRLVAKQKKGA